MEVFSPDRDSDAVFALIGALGEIGIHGRDASYLASVTQDGAGDAASRARYRSEFRYMVAPDKRAAAASVIGLADW